MTTNKPPVTPRAKPDRTHGEHEGLGDLHGITREPLSVPVKPVLEYVPSPEFAERFNEAMEELNNPEGDK